MNTEEALKKVELVLEPVISSLGFDLVERELIFEKGRWILRLYIDNPEKGVTIDDCSTISHAVDGVLDVENLIDRAYSLEVSSPGINRPLRKKEDFIRFKGETVKIKTKQPIDGRSNYKGMLQGMEGDVILVAIDGNIFRIPHDLLEKARLDTQL